MTMQSGTPPDDKNDEISILIDRLHDTEQRLRELTGGNVDAVVYPGGQAYLLQDAQEKLRRSEERFREMFESAPIGIAISTPHGRFLQANASYCAMLGYTNSELQTRNFASLTHPDDLSLNLTLRDDLLAGQRDSFVLEKRYLKKNGDILWTRQSVSAARNAAGEIATLIVIADDISERKQTELRLRRLDRLHTMLNNVGQAIARTDDRQGLYDAVCRIIVDDGLLRMVFIAELDADTRLATPVSSYGEGLEYLRETTSTIPTDGSPLSMGTVGTALRTGFYDVCNDIAAASRMKPWRVAALQSGLLANASFPLIVQGVTIGVLVLYAGETEYFLADEIDLMVTVADNISFALDALAKEEQRRRAEVALRESEARFRGIFDFAATGIGITAPDGRFLQANAAYCRMLGYAEEEMLSRDFPSLTHPDDLALNLSMRDQLLAGRQDIFVMEKRYLKKHGDIIWARTSIAAVRDGVGDVTKFIVVAEDITERKRLEKRIRRLVDSNAQGVIFWNTEGEILDANDAFLTLARYTREDLDAGLINWVAMTPPEYVQLDRHALNEIAATGICTPYEKEWLRKDGSRVPILIGAAIFEDNPDEGVSFVHDLTELKKLQRQFWQAQKMEGIGTLAGGVAHDFNNILAIVLGQAELLRDSGDLSRDHLEAAGEIITTAQYGAALTRQLLLFSSRSIFQPRDLDLNDLIADIMKMFKRTLSEDIDLQFNGSSGPIFLHADAGMLDQVLLNLVVNARDAMSDRGRILIETSSVEFDALAVSQSSQGRVGSFACLSVSDTGCGIPPEHMSKIFEPFFTTKDVGKGTGLGLATVFGVVHQHQGWVNVYSEVGRGTTFRIYLPRMAENTEQKSVPSTLATVRGGSETILLVEDNTGVRASLYATLSRLGYRVLEASTGIKALEMWNEHSHDIRLLLTDLVMPDGMTGRDVAEHLLQENPRLKVIYMSGYSADVIRSALPLEEGVNFLTKPFQAQKLAQAVRKALD